MESSNKKVIFVHGYEASSKHDWFPLVAEELDRLGMDYVIPNMPGGSYPHIQDWLEILNTQLKAAGKPVVLVGYSIGAQAVLLYLEKYKPLNIDTVLLIASFNNDWKHHQLKGNDAYNTFFDRKIDMEVVKQYAKSFVVMHSKDDPWAKYEWGVENAQALHAKLLTYEDRGHFYLPENYKYILEVLKTVL